jgi:signal transduction histidine kinase
MMQLNKKYTILLLAFFLSVTSGFIADWLHNYSNEKTFSSKKFTDILHQKTEQSEQLLLQLSDFADFESNENISDFISGQQDIAGYIFSGDDLIFWNTNQFDIQPSVLTKDSQWHFIQLNNACGIYKWKYSIHNYGILAFINIKTAYQFENNYLKNDFNKTFSTDKNIGISGEKLPDAHHIYDKNNHFLFSLIQNKKPVNNDTFRLTGFISFTIAFIMLFLMYFKINTFFKSKKLNPVQFGLVSAVFGIGILVLCYFDYPKLFFINPIFSPQQYAANVFIKTYTHLSILCFFILEAIFVYHLKVNKRNKQPFAQRIFLYIYIVFFFEITKSLILNSNLSFNLLVLRDSIFTNIWTQFLIFALALGLFFLLHITENFPLKNKLKKAISSEIIFIFATVILYSLIFQTFILYFIGFLIVIIIFDYIRRRYFNKPFDFKTFGIYFFILNFIMLILSYQLNEYKKFNKYKVLTENILVNGNSDNDPIAELLLEELDKNLREDSTLFQLVTKPDSIETMTKYVFNNYLSGFWNKYNVSINVVSNHSSSYEYYKEYLKFNGKKLKETNFYSLPASLYDLSFIGLIEIGADNNDGNTNFLVFEFESKRNFRSYSFPDLLISNESAQFGQLNISIAKYENNKLIYSDLKYDWHEVDTTFNHLKDGFEKVKSSRHKYYVLTKDNLRIVITRISTPNITTLYYYFIFSFLICLLLAKIFFWIYEVKTQQRNYLIGLTTKFQLVFVSLLLMSFLGILIFSTNYISNNYQQEQISTIEKKKQYLQKSLQDLYYWTEDIATIDAQSLKINLEELAYRYQTDINIYDNSGILIGSSQPLIFSKHLLGQMMSPEVYFSNETPGNQYEKIGNLSYLAAYTDMINGDYLQIGYISIPQYLSQTEINAKIEQFLLAIIQIYLIIIIFSVILIIIAGKQLADPLHLLENKLKSMHLGGKNEKVEYKWQDEIGQLVEQYNRTVDELEKSTQLLLQSERETAWRTMARQVAHEINNPLTPMKLTIQQLIRTKQLDQQSFDAYFEKSAQTLIEQIDNLSRIAGTFSQFARMPETKFSRVDVAAKLFSVVELFRNNHENIDISYSGFEKDVYVQGDAEQLLQVFNNILKNATQAILNGAKGKIIVELSLINKEIQIKFIDNGVGIPMSIQQDIFKPNFTTKSTGMGLGLSLSKSFIENMNGTISFSSKIKSGTTFIICLPETLMSELLHSEDI